MLKYLLLIILKIGMTHHIWSTNQIFLDTSEMIKNVGYLCTWKDNIKYSVASVVYIGDGLCLTAAHCYENSDFQYTVHFDHISEYFIINDFILNDEFKLIETSTDPFVLQHKESLQCVFDISIAVLNKPVEGLVGIQPNYQKPEQFNPALIDNHTLAKLICIGYAAKSFWHFFSLTKTREKTICYSDGDIEIMEDILILSGFKRTEPTKSGMSGGALIHPQLGLIGILHGASCDLRRCSSFHASIINSMHRYFNYFIKFITSGSLSFSRFPEWLSPQCNSSIPLYRFENWIEEMRKKYRNVNNV